MIICKNCVMDETDPKIKFDENGVCNHCRNYYSNISQIWKNDGKNENKLKILSANIKKETKNSEFNSSTNPTYISSSGEVKVESFRTDPKTYITTVAMYGDDTTEPLAIAKLSQPILKSRSREALIKVKLDF